MAEKRIPYGWPGSQIYIHYHEENARRAAGALGTDLYSIRDQAVSQLRITAGQRFSMTVFSGETPAKIKEYNNEIMDMQKAISDSDAVVKYLQEILGGTINEALNENLSLGQEVSRKVATMIGGIAGTSQKKLTEQVEELLQLYYETDLASLIKLKQGSPAAIDQAQVENLKQLQALLKGDLKLDTQHKRNLLVDIFTEQGLPDFLQKCAEKVAGLKSNLIESAIHLGAEKIVGSPAKGKIDTNITFWLPGVEHAITQGISVKSNYFGGIANVLSTNFATSLTRQGFESYEAQANAISLMTQEWLGRWFVWANIDRALQGTLQPLASAYNLQDRADLLIEFTYDGFQVYNLNDILYRLVQKIKSFGNKDLGKIGFGVRESYNQIKRYDRTQYENNTPDVISERAKYSNTWLTFTHIIVADIHKIQQALRS